MAARIALTIAGSALRGPQRLVDIINDVFNILDADGKADKVGSDSGRSLLLHGQLLVSGGRWVNHQGFGIADVGKVGEEFHVVDEPLARFQPSLDPEADDRPGAVRKILLGAL